MGGKRAQHHPDRIIIELADRQHRLVHRRQLLERGIGPDAIDNRIASGFLRPIHRGVYAVGGRTLTQEGHFLAAVFALGPGTVLSHHSAAAHLGLRPSASARVAVTAASRNGRKRRPGITVSYCAIHSWEWEEVDGIPTTTVARTLMDLAEQFPARVVEKALTRAQQLNKLDLIAIEAVLTAHPGRIGAKRLKRILAANPISRHAADEGIEELFLAIVDDNNFQRPTIKPDIYLPGRPIPYQPDFYWPALRLIVETDGREAHLTDEAFENDHARNNDLTLARYTVLSFTYLQIKQKPDWVVDQLTRGGVAAR